MPRSRTLQSALAILILCALGVPAWRWAARAPEISAAPVLELGAVPVGLRTMEPESVTVQVRAYGNLRPHEEVGLALEVGGRLEWVWDGWALGAEVAGGQELARVDRSRIELELARAEAAVAEAVASERAAEVERNAARRVLDGVERQLELAVREEARWDDAQASGSVAAGDADRSRANRAAIELARSEALGAIERAEVGELSARARRATLESEVELGRDRLARCTLRAPISGRIGDGVRAGTIPVAGRLVAPGEVLGTLTDESQFILRAQVSESDFAQIQIGDTARIEFSDVRERIAASEGAVRESEGRVIGWATRSDPVTRDVTVELEVLPQDGIGSLVAGLFAHATIDVRESAEALWVDRRHFRWEGGAPIAFVVSEGTAQRRALQLGPEVGEGFVVESGLEPGDRLITEPLDRLVEGREVVPRRGVDAP